MRENDVVTGQNTTWQLLKKMGEGDAGEVYLVEGLVEKQKAILKRPQKSAFSADIVRQANQIAAEAKILKGLQGFKIKLKHSQVRVPKLLDQAKSGNENSPQYFIVMEKASGFDLAFLSKVIHSSSEDIDPNRLDLDPIDKAFLEKILEVGKLPPLIFLSCLESVIALFEEIHHYPIDLDGVEKSGILWNDVKPEHLFWDIENAQCTVIDWGNAQILETDGTTRDRLFTILDDYRQFVDGMGQYLLTTYPELHKKLDWSKSPASIDQYYQDAHRIREKVEALIDEQISRILTIKEREQKILKISEPRVGHIKDLDKICKSLYAMGSMPDHAGGNALALLLAQTLIFDSKFVEFRWLTEWAKKLPCEDHHHWQMLATISNIALSDQSEIPPGFVIAIADGVNGNWENVLWHLLSSMELISAKEWFPALTKTLRHIQLDISPNTPTPLEGVKKFAALLNAEINPKNPQIDDGPELFSQPEKFLGMNEKNRLFLTWLDRLNKVIIPKWQQLEPNPPNAGLEYKDIVSLGVEIGEYYPVAAQYIEKIIYQPGAQMRIILDGWERKNFKFIIKALKKILIWDPDRWRVIAAENLIDDIDGFLDRLSVGPADNESVADFATRFEVIAREYRNRIGKASWLETILFYLKSLRQGEDPAAFARQYPEIVKDLPWLKIYLIQKSKKIGPIHRGSTERVEKALHINLERKTKNQIYNQVLQGMMESEFGEEGDISFSDALDLWKPEAQGSSARVFQGFIRLHNGNLKQRAIKIMRPDQIDYALPLFEEEVRIIQQINTLPGITPILECGFLKPDLEIDRYDTFFRDIHTIKGNVKRFGFDCFNDFLIELPVLSREGWLPYLAIEKKNFEDNLLILCDAGHSNGKLMPVKMGLVAAIQICDIMAQVHKLNIVYRDHKILHYYWQDLYNGVFIIDWNVAKIYERNLTESEKQFDLVQFGARALHHILTGRPAPGALPLGPTRPEEIELASEKYAVAWTFDDNRLNHRVKRILEKTLVGEYIDASHLKAEMLEVYHENDFVD